MTQIYCHKFTFTLLNRGKCPIREVTVVVESENREMSHFDALKQLIDFPDESCNVRHEVISGYKDASAS